MIYTAFCRDADGTGTTWIQAIDAPDPDTAQDLAVKECASDWDQDADTIECFGLAAGDVQIVRWDD